MEKKDQITREELIEKYIKFLKSKKHKEIPNAGLVPRDSSTSLFIGSGMETIIPYLLGQKHPLGKRLVNVQKCIRTTDIEEIGDTYHHTFFEMLGNWSLGDYWKEDAIKMTFEFLTNILGIKKERLAATCFRGNKKIPKDTESEKTYLNLEFPKERIALLDEKSNFWGPVGETGPCGPNTEIFYWASKEIPPPNKFNPNDERWLEIGNNVLISYNKNKQGDFEKLKQKNIDFGGGVERTIATLNGFEDNYMADMWKPIIKKIEDLSNKNYKENEKVMRIIADHIKASVFIISDGVLPSNTGRGYVLRRLIRRSVVHGKKIELKKFLSEIAKPIFKIYKDYAELKQNKNKILKTIKEEEEKFNKTLNKGLKIFSKIYEKRNEKYISGKQAFLLYQSYGFPIEMTTEIAKEKGLTVDIDAFKKELKKHKELSQKASAGSFKSGLSDNSEKTTRLHTATHLLNESLRNILGEEIKQRGSNINPKRLRFDFNFPRKLTKEEIEKIEGLVNKKIKENLPVKKEEMPLQKALKSGAQAEFGAKYPEIVSVYTILDDKDKKGWFSKEICTGPHVKNTGQIGKFKIIKEESSASGIRRVKAEVSDKKINID